VDGEGPGPAMDSFLKRQAGPQAHLWDMVMAEVFQPIGIFHAPTMHTQEQDGGRGIPLLAYGLYVTIDDVARLTTLLHHSGQHQGQQLLSAAKLAEALYKTEVRGLPTDRGWYHLSVWSTSHESRTGCAFQIADQPSPRPPHGRGPHGAEHGRCGFDLYRHASPELYGRPANAAP